MNILFISDNFYPEVNAAASRVYERARYWVKWGHSVTVLTCAPNFPEGKVYAGYRNRFRQVEWIDGIRVVRVKTYMASNAGFVRRTCDFMSFMLMSVVMGLFESKPDVVVATTPQFFAGLGGRALAWLKRAAFILEVSDLWPASIRAVGAMQDGFLYRQLERLELALYRSASKIIVLTDAFQSDLVRRGISRQKIGVVKNGVELSHFRPTEKDSAVIDAHQLAGKFVIGYIGTLGMAHGLHRVLQAAKQLAHRPHIHFLFVGAGADRSALMEAARSEGLTNVTFVDRQPKDKIKHYWSVCDVALVHLKNDPVFQDVIPSKMFEAMAMGLPILLCMPKGEASEILAEDEAGWWVSPDAPEALSEMIQTLSEQPNVVLTQAKKSQSAAKRHSREQQAAQMIEALLV